MGTVQGSTQPKPSPDGRWIAYGNRAEDYDIHLLNVRTSHQHTITRWGRPPTIGSVSVDVLIDGWSPGSRRLLLYTTSGEDLFGQGRLAVPNACYGFYEYDVASRKVTAVPLPKSFGFVAWLRNGRFVGVIPGRLPADDKLVLLRPGEAGQTEIRAVNTFPYQARVSRDRKWLVGLHSESGRLPGKGTARIVKVNLRTMAATPLVALASWSGNEQPTLSPDDKQVAYKRQASHTGLYFAIQESLYVDTRQMYSCSGMIDFEWVDSGRIVLACHDQVLVLDTNSAKTLSNYKLAPVQTPH